jgi:hypothetical protein
MHTFSGALTLVTHTHDRVNFVAGSLVAAQALSCLEVHGVRAGETCFSVALVGGLKLEEFLHINPNINCEKVFVGQWICLAATSA